MSRALHILLGVTVALLLVFSPPARGQDAVDEAREAFWVGNDAYVEGDYPTALEQFQLAYELAPNAALLEYIGRTYVGMGRYPEAIASFERFAEEDPEAGSEIAELVEALREDMLDAAFAAARDGVGRALAVARGEQPTSQADSRAQLGTRMTNVPVQVVSTPRAAEVFIDGTEYGAFGVTPLETRLFTGPHLIEVRKPYYEPASQVVNVSVPRRGESIAVVRFTLERQQVATEVSVRPLTARISHVSEDGERTDLGTGAWTGTLPAGPGTFIIQNAGRDRRVERVLEPSDDGAVVEVALSLDEDASGPSIAISVGTLVVVSQVDEGRVLVDGRSIGEGIGEFEAMLTPGPHRLEVTKDGHEPFEQTVEIQADGTATVYVNALERAGRRRR